MTRERKRRALGLGSTIRNGEQLEERLPLAAPGQEPLSLHAAQVTDSVIELAWNAPEKGADSYLVASQQGGLPDEKCGNGVSTNDASMTLSNLDSASTYFTRVCAVNGSRVSAGATLEIITDPPGEAPDIVLNARAFPHRTAISDNGDAMVVWQNHLDSNWHVFFARYNGTQLLESGRLSADGRHVGGLTSGRNPSMDAWNLHWGAMDVAAGDDGNFVVAWLDENLNESDARLNINRFTASNGWDHAIGQNSLPADSPTSYSINDGDLLKGLNGVNVDMAPNGNAAVALTEGVYTWNLSLWVFYRENEPASNWEQIAADGKLTDANGGEEDTTQYGSPGMEMDANGNILIAYATDSDLLGGSGMDVQYAVYDRTSNDWGPGRQTISSGWAVGQIETVRVAVDKTRDLTDSTQSSARGLAGIAWTTSTDHVYGAFYYKAGVSSDVGHVAQLSPADGTPVELHGFDVADGEGHVLATWTDINAHNQQLVHFWYEDLENDGTLESVAGWKTDPQTVNDASILNSPYLAGDAREIGAGGVRNNPSRLSVGPTGGAIVWSNLAEDTVHVRRIIGFDHATQNVLLEGDESNSISDAANHTLASSTEWQNADWVASTNVNYETSMGVTLHHSETDGRLHFAPISAANSISAKVIASPTSGVTTTEDGGSVVLNVTLSAQPTSDVSIAVTVSDPTEVTTSTGVLSFDETNWNVSQPVTITGLDDPDLDGDINYQVSFDPASSLAPEYAGLTPVVVNATNVDNEVPAGSTFDIYVWNIDFDTRTRGKNTDLLISANIKSDSDADAMASFTDDAASGVQVTLELRDASGNLVETFVGTTDSDGVFRTGWIGKLDAGDYTAEVVDLAHATLDWNHLLDLGFDDEDRDGDGLPDDTVSLI